MTDSAPHPFPWQELAENPDYPPIAVNGPLPIEGLMVGLIRDGRTL